MLNTRRIEQVLGALVGLPLWSAGRAGNLEWFHFGDRRVVPDHRGASKVVGAYALHVQVACRIAGPAGIVVGSSDRYVAAGDDPFRADDDFDWDRQGANRCDERVAAFFTTRGDDSLIVEAIRVDEVGGFRLALTGTYSLDVFPETSLEGERWRLFRPATTGEHFVVTGRGIED